MVSAIIDKMDGNKNLCPRCAKQGSLIPHAHKGRARRDDAREGDVHAGVALLRDAHNTCR